MKNVFPSGHFSSSPTLPLRVYLFSMIKASSKTWYITFDIGPTDCQKGNMEFIILFVCIKKSGPLKRNRSMCASGKIKAMVSTVMYKIIDGFYLSFLLFSSFARDWTTERHKLLCVFYATRHDQQQPRAKRKFQSENSRSSLLVIHPTSWLLCTFDVSHTHLWQTRKKKKNCNECFCNLPRQPHFAALFNLGGTCIAWKWVCTCFYIRHRLDAGLHRTIREKRETRFRFNSLGTNFTKT